MKLKEKLAILETTGTHGNILTSLITQNLSDTGYNKDKLQEYIKGFTDAEELSTNAMHEILDCDPKEFYLKHRDLINLLAVKEIVGHNPKAFDKKYEDLISVLNVDDMKWDIKTREVIKIELLELSRKIK